MYIFYLDYGTSTGHITSAVGETRVSFNLK